MVVVVVVEVDVVVVGQISITLPPPSVVTTGFTQLSSTTVCGDRPAAHVSGQDPASVMSAENRPRASEMQPPVSTGTPSAAAFA
jgi:hypothetical protein